MATPGERIHVVKCPDDWKTIRQRAKELAVPDKPRYPMQVEHIGRKRLSKHVATMLTAVVAEITRARGS
jgi:hypothetical protein